MGVGVEGCGVESEGLEILIGRGFPQELKNKIFYTGESRTVSRFQRGNLSIEGVVTLMGEGLPQRFYLLYLKSISFCACSNSSVGTHI